jgi:hypothetical protein
MKRILSLLLLALAASVSLSAQDAKALYKDRYSYDLKQNRLSVRFDGNTFWLRMSALKNDTLTLTYMKDKDTLTTATEFLTFSLLPAGVTLDDYIERLIESTRKFMPGPPDITNFADFVGGQRKIVTSLLKDPGNNLLEDDIMLLTQLKGQKLRVMVHTKRLKLDEALAKPETATAAIGDKRSQWMTETMKVVYPF